MVQYTRLFRKIKVLVVAVTQYSARHLKTSPTKWAAKMHTTESREESCHCRSNNGESRKRGVDMQTEPVSLHYNMRAQLLRASEREARAPTIYTARQVASSRARFSFYFSLLWMAYLHADSRALVVWASQPREIPARKRGITKEARCVTCSAHRYLRLSVCKCLWLRRGCSVCRYF